MANDRRHAERSRARYNELKAGVPKADRPKPTQAKTRTATSARDLGQLTDRQKQERALAADAGAVRRPKR